MQPMTHRHTKELDIYYKENRKKCTNCGKTFVDGSTVHVGYTHEGDHAVLCDECSYLLQETVVRYYHQADPFESPFPDDKLWRYMDLAKFISIISTKTLYFASLKSFDDPFEGAKGPISCKENWDKFYLNFFRQAIKTAPCQGARQITKQDIEENAQRLLRELDINGKKELETVYVNCWHDNENESEAMWKLYSKNVANAVAIQTTAEKLYLALNRSPDINIGKVQYIDFDRRYAPVNGSFWYKRKAFEHEREVRAVVRSDENHHNGILVPINIDMLIEKVYISPYAPSWFAEVVRSVMNQYNIDKPISDSKLTDTPFY